MTGEETEAELSTLRAAVTKLKVELGRWPSELPVRAKDEPSLHAKIVADLLQRPWPRCQQAQLPVQISVRTALQAPLIGPDPAPKVQASATPPSADEAETDCSSGQGEDANVQLTEESPQPDAPGSRSARSPQEEIIFSELEEQRDEALRQLAALRQDFTAEVEGLRLALRGKDASLKDAEVIRTRLMKEAAEMFDARERLSTQLRSEQLAFSRCQEELAQSRAAHQQEWLLGKQLTQDLKAARATAEALRADLRDASERIADEHATNIDLRAALDQERRESHRLAQALEKVQQELRCARTPAETPSLEEEPTPPVEWNHGREGPQLPLAAARRHSEPAGLEEIAQLARASSPKVTAMARLMGQGGPDQEETDADVARKVSFLEGQLRRYGAERDSLETALRKLPSNTTGRSVAERRRIGEMEQRLADVERTMLELKTAVRRLRQADG